MWLITPLGFFSISQKAGKKRHATLTLCSELRSDLAALKQHYLPSLGPIQESHDSDYCFYAEAPRADVSVAMARLVDDLNYSDLKSAVDKKQGERRARLYHKIEDTLHLLRDRQVIVMVGCEGGSLTLQGIQSPEGWKFRAETNESALVDDDIPPFLNNRPWVGTWREALKQLDRYAWPRFYPIAVHPEFRDKVINALRARQKKGVEIFWPRWRKVLSKQDESV